MTPDPANPGEAPAPADHVEPVETYDPGAELLKRVVASAFDAGVRAASASASDRLRQKAEFQDYAASMFTGLVMMEMRKMLEAEQ